MYLAKNKFHMTIAIVEEENAPHRIHFLSLSLFIQLQDCKSVITVPFVLI